MGCTAYPGPGSRLLVTLLFLLILPPAFLSAQASPTLPLDHPAHLVLQHLAATGVIPAFPRGEGGRTRAMVVRLLTLADSAAHAMTPSGRDPLGGDSRARAIQDLVERGSRGLQGEIRQVEEGGTISTRRPLHELRLGLMHLDSPPRGIPANGLGFSAAVVNPLGALHQGRPAPDGTTWRGSTVHSWSSGGAVALQVHPFVTWTTGAGGDGGEVGLHQAVIRLRTGNLELRGGRDVLVREQWAGRGLVLSGGPRNWDLLEVGTAEPVELPWLLGLLGPVEARVFGAHMGPEQTFENGWMVGYRGSIRPHPRFELGGTALFQQGGEGGPEATWGDRVLDALLLPDLLDADSDFLFSNKLVGVDMRLRLPWGRGMELFGEMALDDFDHRRLRSSFLDNGGFTGGVFLPSLDRDGRMSLAAAVQRTGPSLYRHNRYRTGLTLDGRPTGSTLGPDGTGGYLRFMWFPRIPAIITVEGAWERYRGDRYRVFGEPDFRYERVETLPVERRIRGTTTVQWVAPGSNFDLRARVGTEQVRNQEFTEGEDRTGVLLELGIVMRP